MNQNNQESTGFHELLEKPLSAEEREWAVINHRNLPYKLPDYRNMLTGDLFMELEYIKNNLQEMISYGLDIGEYWSLFSRLEREYVLAEIQRRQQNRTMPRGIYGYSKEYIEEIRGLHTISQVFGSFGIYQAKNKKYLCPFHKEKNASLSVNEASKIWKCFSCNLGGDIFKLVMLLKDCSFRESVDYIKSM